MRTCRRRAVKDTHIRVELSSSSLPTTARGGHTMLGPAQGRPANPREARPMSASATPPVRSHDNPETPPPGPGNGRDASGRFTAGNKYGPGNPFARQTAELRKVLLEV